MQILVPHPTQPPFHLKFSFLSPSPSSSFPPFYFFFFKFHLSTSPNPSRLGVLMGQGYCNSNPTRGRKRKKKKREEKRKFSSVETYADKQQSSRPRTLERQRRESSRDVRITYMDWTARQKTRYMVSFPFTFGLFFILLNWSRPSRRSHGILLAWLVRVLD